MSSDRLRLFHLSDIHFGLEDRDALAWVRDEIAAKRPAAVVITGDHTMRARHHEFAAATRWITALDVPVTISIGNHDMPYFNLIERFFDPYKRFEGMKTLVEREIDLPGLAIVPLKTVRRWQPRMNWSKGWVTAPALADCLDALDRLPAGTRALVAVHHPLREAGTHGTALTRGGENALRELARRNVLGVLSGHVHDAFASHPLNAAQLQRINVGRRAAGGGGAQSRRCADARHDDRGCPRGCDPAAHAGRTGRPGRSCPPGRSPGALIGAQR